MARQWDEWARSSEMRNPGVNPSRKRIRITICAGTSSGHEIGQASIEGVINHDQQATVTFKVVETLVGGLNDGTVDEATATDQGLRRDATQANPQLANFARDHLPGLAETVSDFMASVEGRYWLWQFSTGVTSLDVILERLGQEIAEAFQLWVAMQEDTDQLVRNVANGVVWNSEGDRASSAGSSTVAVERPEQAENDGISQDGPSVARVEGEDGAKEDQETQGELDDEGMERGSAPTQQETQGDLDMRTMDCEGDNSAGGSGHGAESDLPEVLPGDSDLHEGDDRHAREGDSELPAGEGEDGRSALCERDDRAAHAEEEGQGAEVEAGFDAVEMSHGEGNSNNHGQSDMVLGEGMDVESAYDVPSAWRRVLEAWNDPAVGAGLADSVLSGGEFEHAVNHLDDSQLPETSSAENAGGDAAAAGPSSSPTARGSSSTESTEGGLRQTDLKSWLK